MSALLEVRGLKTHFFTEGGVVKAADGVSFALDRGRTLALVGESGCGKSVTALSILRLVAPPGRIVAGEILFEGKDLARTPEKELRRVRGDRIAMIFQEPMASLNPVYTVGAQIAEAVRVHRDVSRRAARSRAVDLLKRVGIPAAEERVDEYPHRFSGGMLQRAMIAMALACEPAVLIADEPTTALDGTTQAQILDLLRKLQEETGMAILLITHNLALVAEAAHEIAVMYAGKIVERSSAGDLFAHPLHPYTHGLLGSIPRLGAPKGRKLAVIPGSVPDPARYPPGCRFHPRCPARETRCETDEPLLEEARPDHMVGCLLVEGGLSPMEARRP